MNPDSLADLCPYRLPDPVAWWPLAPGWWFLAALLGLALFGLAWWWRRRHRRRAAARQAERELDALYAGFVRDGDAQALARGYSRLLRRLALTRFGQAAVAGLTGEPWLAFLDAQGGGEAFRYGPGRVLLQAPYRAEGPVDVAALTEAVRGWIRQQQGRRRC